MKQATPVLAFRGLVKRYPHRDGDGELTVLDGLERSIMPGEFVTLVGPSGCGKSTLFKLILGTIDPTEGQVLLDGRPVVKTGPDRGIVFQKYGLFPHLTVRQNVMLGGTIRRPPFARFRPGYRAEVREDQERAVEYLSRVRMNGDGILDKYPHELSGGMQQRVAIAQTLFTHPRLVLMDEPFGALDTGTRQEAQLFLIELWEEINKTKGRDMTVLFVTHALEEAVFLGTRVLALSQHYEHPDGPHRTDNGSRFVIDRDLRKYIKSRRELTHEEYISQFTHVMDEIALEAMDPTVRQLVSDFRKGAPPPPEIVPAELLHAD